MRMSPGGSLTVELCVSETHTMRTLRVLKDAMLEGRWKMSLYWCDEVY